MYEAFYGFKEKPFSMLPDPGFLYLSKKHQAALTLLEYGLLNHVGFCVISGEAGAGKTTILRALLERVENNVSIGLITNTHQSFGGLLDWVLSSFDLHQPNLSQVEMHQVFMEYLIEEYANNRTVLLIVDEAQNMKADTLEELRMLSNVNSEKDQLMQVVLAGQPALKDTLRKPELMQFAQRIAVDYHLGPLNVVETCGYIQHRLLTAGAQYDVFTPAACERIHNYSGGTPRLINLLCETVMVYGFADQQKVIDVDLVDEMVQERMKDSVVPIVNRDAAEKDNKEAAKALEKDFPWIEAKENEQSQTEKPKADTVLKDVQAVDEQVITEEKIKPDDAVVNESTVFATKKTPPATSALDRGKAKNSPTKLEAEEIPKTTPKPEYETQNTEAVEVEKTRQPPIPAMVDVQEEGAKKQLLKYGILAAIIAVILVAAALFLSSEDDSSETVKANSAIDFADKETSQKAADEAILQVQEKHEQESARVEQLQIEAEKLKKERDQAIAKAEEEKQAKQKAEKRATEEVALAAEKANKKRIAEKKESERRTKQKEAKIKAEASRIKREKAKLKAERRAMQARLKKEKRLKQKAEVEKLEREWLEQQRQQLLQEEQAAVEVETRAEQKAVLEAKAKEIENRSSECSGPTARFKASCR